MGRDSCPVQTYLRFRSGPCTYFGTEPTLYLYTVQESVSEHYNIHTVFQYDQHGYQYYTSDFLNKRERQPFSVIYLPIIISISLLPSSGNERKGSFIFVTHWFLSFGKQNIPCPYSSLKAIG